MTHRARSLSFLKLRPVRRRDESGAALVEFSLVVGLLVMLVLGLIVFGMALALKHNVTSAAASGARAAVGAPDPVDAARQQVDEDMSAFSGTYDTPVAASVSPCAGGTGDCITVTVIAHPTLGEVPLMGALVPQNIKSTAVVRVS